MNQVRSVISERYEIEECYDLRKVQSRPHDEPTNSVLSTFWHCWQLIILIVRVHFLPQDISGTCELTFSWRLTTQFLPLRHMTWSVMIEMFTMQVSGVCPHHLVVFVTCLSLQLVPDGFSRKRKRTIFISHASVACTNGNDILEYTRYTLCT